MPIGQPLPASCEEDKTPPIRYCRVSTADRSFSLKQLNTDEAYLVQNFECVEDLVARGADSARIAISEHIPPDGPSPEYSQLAFGSPLVPNSPFTFDQSIVIVLPTYNERSNLEALINAIGRYLVADILVVDDNSPDGTGQLADELSCKHRHVHVLHRPQKQGLGPAYLAGFNWALQRKYDRIIEMDCDFSHAPWDLPRLVHGSKTANLVIGSRYVPGGGTDNWDARRRLVSRCGNTYVRLFLGPMIQDWTGGFRCYHRDLLMRMRLETVGAKGYVFQVELAWRAVQLGAEIREIPIRFTDRVQGQSKLGWSSLIEGLLEVPKMSFHR
ncbi:MAG: polyprenol monophosphomannose synthase [Nitrospira sp.]|nr:polyprenol monophosphomannose synthase [Nitrospira sp.]